MTSVASKRTKHEPACRAPTDLVVARAAKDRKAALAEADASPGDDAIWALYLAWHRTHEACERALQANRVACEAAVRNVGKASGYVALTTDEATMLDIPVDREGGPASLRAFRNLACMVRTETDTLSVERRDDILDGCRRFIQRVEDSWHTPAMHGISERATALLEIRNQLEQDMAALPAVTLEAMACKGLVARGGHDGGAEMLRALASREKGSSVLSLGLSLAADAADYLRRHNLAPVVPDIEAETGTAAGGQAPSAEHRAADFVHRLWAEEINITAIQTGDHQGLLYPMDNARAAGDAIEDEFASWRAMTPDWEKQVFEYLRSMDQFVLAPAAE